MAGQLNIKLLVPSVHNLRVLLIFFVFILFISCFLQFSGAKIHFKKISILQAFNCRCLEIFNMTYIFFSLI